jgi:hypothetical protein
MFGMTFQQDREIGSRKNAVGHTGTKLAAVGVALAMVMGAPKAIAGTADASAPAQPILSVVIYPNYACTQERMVANGSFEKQLHMLPNKAWTVSFYNSEGKETLQETFPVKRYYIERTFAVKQLGIPSGERASSMVTVVDAQGKELKSPMYSFTVGLGTTPLITSFSSNFELRRGSNTVEAKVEGTRSLNLYMETETLRLGGISATKPVLVDRVVGKPGTDVTQLRYVFDFGTFAGLPRTTKIVIFYAQVLHGAQSEQLWLSNPNAKLPATA